MPRFAANRSDDQTKYGVPQSGQAGQGHIGEESREALRAAIERDPPSRGDDRGEREAHRLVSPDESGSRGLQEELQPSKGQLLGPLADRVGVRAIFGEIPRMRFPNTDEYPYRAICALIPQIGGKIALGTGWFISSNVIMTAGHNLFNNPILPPGWVDSIEVRPGANGWNGTPYGKYTVRDRGRMKVSSDWVERGDATLDYAIIILDQPIGNRTGSFRIDPPFPASELGQMRLNVIGYPGDVDPPITMWGNSGFVIRDGVRQRTLQYRMDTAGGQSGAPLIFVPDGRGPKDPVWSVGVHNHAFSTYNSATRITDAVYSTVTQWLS